MAAPDVAHIRPDGGTTQVVLHVGDGVIADWTVKVRRGDAVVAQDHGLTSAGDPPPLTVPAPAIGCAVEWLVVLFGAGEARDYSVRLQVEQGGRGTVQPPVVRLGRVEARDTATETGQVRLRREP